MHDTIRIINERIKEFLLVDNPLHVAMDKHPVSSVEINRRCDGEDEIDKKCINRLLYYTWCDLKGYHGLKIVDLFYSLVNQDDFLKIKASPLDYNHIIDSTISDIKNAHSKYNIIVPVRNRMDNLESFLENASNVLGGKNDWSVTIVFQEESDEAFLKYRERKYKDNFNVNFISIRHNSWFDDNFGKNMNKSLCYNVASLMVSCEYQVNHDIDLLFSDDFVTHIETKTNNEKFRWLQPYRGSRVIFLNEKESNEIRYKLNNNLPCEFPNKNIRLNLTPNAVGAPGGSIVVKYEDFLEVGGYDPELIWGYGPEDSIFWYKLEAKFGCIQERFKLHPFCSDDVFSHETQVELYHLHHPLTSIDKTLSYYTQYILMWLLNKSERNTINKWLDVSKEKLRTKV